MADEQREDEEAKRIRRCHGCGSIGTAREIVERECLRRDAKKPCWAKEHLGRES